MKNKKIRVARAKRTFFGRMLCRLMGEEIGAVAMEYVIIGLLVAAAAVGAVMFFGDAITSGFKYMADMILGEKKVDISEGFREGANSKKTAGDKQAEDINNNTQGEGSEDSSDDNNG